jgi:hypothetical protein
MFNYLVTLVGASGKTTMPWRVRATTLEDAHTEALAKYAAANGVEALSVHSVIEPIATNVVYQPEKKSTKNHAKKKK